MPVSVGMVTHWLVSRLVQKYDQNLWRSIHHCALISFIITYSMFKAESTKIAYVILNTRKYIFIYLCLIATTSYQPDMFYLTKKLNRGFILSYSFVLFMLFLYMFVHENFALSAAPNNCMLTSLLLIFQVQWPFPFMT